MSKQLIWGLYGVVGTGKSTVSQHLQEKGWAYINQDALGHEVLQEHPQELAHIFGDVILTDDKVDRKKLGELVFTDSDLRQKLMDFSYPIIIKKTLELIQKNNSNNVIVEGANFYKVREQIPHTHLIYITVPPQILFERLLQRGHSAEWIHSVLDSQKDILARKSLADFTLVNDQDVSYLGKQIDFAILSCILQEDI